MRDLCWWTDEDPSAKVVQRARDIASSQQWRRTADEMHLRLYGQNEWRGTYGIDRRNISSDSSNKKRLSINVVRNVTNAATSMLIRSRPYVSFQTDGADFSTLTKSRKRERFVQAHFIRDKIHQLAHPRVRNACIFGTGGTKIIRKGGKLLPENILPGEILVDDQEGIAGDPPCIYQGKLIDKLQLAAMYPEHADRIMKAAGFNNSRGDEASQCLAVYAWHFRSTDEKKHDGLEALCVDGATLYKREYRWKTFPGTFFRWEESPFGFYGTGIPAELVGIQYEINSLLRMVQDACYYGGNLKIAIQKGSTINQAQLSNSARVPVIEYTGAPPTWIANDVASAQIFNHLQYLVQTAYNITGVSQLDAQSQTPAASMSGRARLVHQNNESLRFKPAVERYENGYIELAERLLEAATDEYEENGDQTVIYRGKEHLEQISLKDVMLEGPDEPLEIQKFSSSQLAQTPEARMEQVDFLVSNGYLPKTRGLVMMDLGNDFRADMDMANAPYNLIDEMIERVLYDGEVPQAKPYMDLDYAKERLQLEIQRCEMREGVPEERIQMLRDFWQDVIDLQKGAQAGAMPPTAAASPMAGPEQVQMGGAVPAPIAPVNAAVPGLPVGAAA